MIDFTKAFDTVDHAILVAKLVAYNVSPPVINWIISFLSGRSQVCKVNGHYFNPCTINRGIVQRSAIGPQFYTVIKSNLKLLSSDNIFVKYADDIIFLVSANSTVDTATELCHTQAWAVANKLGANTKKTKKMVLRQPRAKSHYMPPVFDDVERVASAKFLGVIFQDNFKMDLHVNSILS